MSIDLLPLDLVEHILAQFLNINNVEYWFTCKQVCKGFDIHQQHRMAKEFKDKWNIRYYTCSTSKCHNFVSKMARAKVAKDKLMKCKTCRLGICFYCVGPPFRYVKEDGDGICGNCRRLTHTFDKPTRYEVAYNSVLHLNRDDF